MVILRCSLSITVNSYSVPLHRELITITKFKDISHAYAKAVPQRVIACRMCGFIWLSYLTKNTDFLRRISYCCIGGKHLFSIDTIGTRSGINYLRSDFNFITLQCIQYIFSQPHLLHQSEHLFNATFTLLVKTIQRIGIFALQVIIKILYKFIVRTVFCRQFPCFYVVNIRINASNSTNAHFFLLARRTNTTYLVLIRLVT